MQDSLSSRITPRFVVVDEGHTVMSSTVTGQVDLRAVFPQNEEEFSFMKVELELVRSCPR